MGDELVVISQSAQELAPAVREFASAVRRSEPAEQLLKWIADEIRYRREPRKAALLMRSAEKVRKSGIPVRAVEDRLLRAVLEEGSLENDPDMQERWSSLLANSVVADARPHVAFPRLLTEISPVEARMLDAMYLAIDDELAGRTDSIHRFDGFSPGAFVEKLGIELKEFPAAAKNLERLGLAERTGVHIGPAISRTDAHEIESRSIKLTYFGAEFVLACSRPGLSRAVVELQIAED